MKKIPMIFMMVIIFFFIVGCQRDFKPRDANIEWFDPTIYQQEVFDKCYGDGYVFWVHGDPDYCPIYTQAQLDAKFSTYLKDVELTYIDELGINNINNTMDSLESEYESLTDDQEILDRLHIVFFYTLFALDKDMNEKIVYMPSHMPKGVESKLFIYDYPMDISFIKIKETIEDHEGQESVFEFNGYNWTTNGKVMINYELVTILSMDIFNNIRLTKDSSIFLGKLHFEMMINYKAYDGDVLVEDSQRQIFGLIEDQTFNIYAYTGRDAYDEITYDVIYRFEIE